MEKDQVIDNRLVPLLSTGLFAGIIAAGVNICYMLLYESTTGYSNDEYINFLNVAIASIVPGVFAGLLLFATLKTSVSAGINAFLIITIVAGLISFLGPLNTTLPNGEPMPPEFAGLTVPMHIFAPMIYVVMLIRTVKE